MDWIFGLLAMAIVAVLAWWLIRTFITVIPLVAAVIIAITIGLIPLGAITQWDAFPWNQERQVRCLIDTELVELKEETCKIAGGTVVVDGEPSPSPKPTPAPSLSPTPAPSLSPTPVPSSPPPGTTTAGGAPTEVSGIVRPVLHHASDCVPEITSGCSFDVGVHQDQVGLAFGVKVSYPKGGLTADSGANGRCALAVLGPDNWFENLHIVDGRFEVYTVPANDVQGWLKTLAVQRANEQAADYGCPTKSFEQIPQWTSGVASPPNGDTGRGATTSASTTTGGTSQIQPQSITQVTQVQTNSQQNCETLDCFTPRIASVDHGGTAMFHKGEAVAGYEIRTGGRTYRNCYFRSAPGDGTVIDGVVHPWPGEVQGMSECR